jgi:hypothetical protein
MVLTLCVAGSLATAKTSHAPLPSALMEAKTVYIDNQSGTASFTDRCYDELSKWGRFKIVADPKQADIVFRISSFTRTAGASATTTTTDYGSTATSTTNIDENRYGYTRIDVLASSTNQVLWSDTRRWGNLFTGFKSATRAVVQELRKRMEEQERK